METNRDYSTAHYSGPRMRTAKDDLLDQCKADLVALGQARSYITLIDGGEHKAYDLICALNNRINALSLAIAQYTPKEKLL